MHALLRTQQNGTLAAFAGAACALLSALAATAIALRFSTPTLWMAPLIGLATGCAVRLGKGVDPMFGFMGATFAALGCILSKTFTLVGTIADTEDIPAAEVLHHADPAKLAHLLIDTIAVAELPLVLAALVAAFRCARRTPTPSPANRTAP
jgi:hypothetical protein